MVPPRHSVSPARRSGRVPAFTLDQMDHATKSSMGSHPLQVVKRASQFGRPYLIPINERSLKLGLGNEAQ